ncbi:reverse transcriptase [Gossypium australe]|uniref:Reverse transcriptase n=1 Tax=Gossypium australe TaxID=47621 RepID=A0A5B6VCL6_9ROSI|nr:reverse transcriptase [Gossypium australe]
MKGIMKEYEDMWGQLVNFDKTLIYFNNNRMERGKIRTRNELRVRILINPKKYLELPTMVGRRKKMHLSIPFKTRLETNYQFLKPIRANIESQILSNKGVHERKVRSSPVFYTVEHLGAQYFTKRYWMENWEWKIG